MNLWKNRFLLFLISSNGVPKHWTTSVNKGDTEDVYNWAHILRRNWCYQLSLPNVILATIFFNTVFLFTYFLSFVSAARRSARNSCSQGPRSMQRKVNSISCLQTSIFPRWKNFASCPDWAIETAFEQVVRVYERYNRIQVVGTSLRIYCICGCFNERPLDPWPRDRLRLCHVWSSRISDIYFADVYKCISVLENWRRPQKLQAAQSSTSYSP